MKPPILVMLLFVFASSSRATFNFKGHHHRFKDNDRNVSSKEQLNIGLILPHTNFGVREYTRAINNAVAGLHRGRGRNLNWVKDRNFNPKNIHNVLMTLTPSPTGKYRSSSLLLA
ncbi:hypothetical protein GWI33_012371 [Rhynchophorus ferrugineus]|uniref:Uncharacterized protein n=1 Tax=Rhynchophorus ferrugineus TaxID=354439 RepID=A0A834MCJ1_RHYFE|nr:hypothetical protein GWI33_012371 [Rhynchophorus ferrugineus]